MSPPFTLSLSFFCLRRPSFPLFRDSALPFLALLSLLSVYRCTARITWTCFPPSSCNALYRYITNPAGTLFRLRVAGVQGAEVVITHSFLHLVCIRSPAELEFDCSFACPTQIGRSAIVPAKPASHQISLESLHLDLGPRASHSHGWTYCQRCFTTCAR